MKEFLLSPTMTYILGLITGFLVAILAIESDDLIKKIKEKIRRK